MTASWKRRRIANTAGRISVCGLPAKWPFVPRADHALGSHYVAHFVPAGKLSRITQIEAVYCFIARDRRFGARLRMSVALMRCAESEAMISLAKRIWIPCCSTREHWCMMIWGKLALFRKQLQPFLPGICPHMYFWGVSLSQWSQKSFVHFDGNAFTVSYTMTLSRALKQSSEVPIQHYLPLKTSLK